MNPYLRHGRSVVQAEKCGVGTTLGRIVLDNDPSPMVAGVAIAIQDTPMSDPY
jgi:hypothetical protein